MKALNYLAKFPPETTTKNIQAFRDYDLITSDVPAPWQRLCPHCGSIDRIIKDSGTQQTVRHIPSNHKGTAVTFHKRRLYCKECHLPFYENPYWVHPSLHMTQALYDSILLDLAAPSPSPKLPATTVLHRAPFSLFFSPSNSDCRESFPRPSALMRSKETRHLELQGPQMVSY